MKKAILFLAVCSVIFALSIKAQAQGPPKPGPELKRLSYQVGTWKTEGEAKAFAGMPGGKMTATETCKWYTGGFFVMCTADGTGPMGAEKSVSFSGYDLASKTYTFHEFSSGGDAIEAKGTVEGNTWHWTSPDSKMGDVTLSVRATITEVSKTEYTFKLEMSQNGGAFETVEESTAHKVTAPAAAPAKKSS